MKSTQNGNVALLFLTISCARSHSRPVRTRKLNRRDHASATVIVRGEH